MTHETVARAGLTGIVLSLALFAGQSKAAVLYYNDGTVNDFTETFGDVMVDVPWNASFAPGGFMHGTPDDVAPFNTIDNRGIVTKTGAAGGVQGGGVRIVVPVPVAAAQRGVVVATYGSQGQEKLSPGVLWKANIRNLAKRLGVDPRTAEQIWAAGPQESNGQIIPRLVKYVGDPLVSIPPDDLTREDLETLNRTAIDEALKHDNFIPIFWEVTGTRSLGQLDLLLGDFGLTTGFADMLHHIPYLAILDNVGPQDFGIDIADANMLSFNGDDLVGSGSFVQTMSIAFEDPPEIPVPASLPLIVTALGALFAARAVERRRSGAGVTRRVA